MINLKISATGGPASGGKSQKAAFTGRSVAKPCHSERGRRPTRNLQSLAIFFAVFLFLAGPVFLSAAATAQAQDAGFLPACILDARLDKNSECRDVGIFIILGIKIANYLFTIVGALALLMFVYGGMLFIISSGSPERVKKGVDAMLAAVIGLIVVFSAYLLVGFLGEVVGVLPKFKL